VKDASDEDDAAQAAVEDGDAENASDENQTEEAPVEDGDADDTGEVEASK
jgi:hypothetical protein